ncbi:MAG: VCBS repeat-containing protein, partial [Chthoniobacteraceae bacterium]
MFPFVHAGLALIASVASTMASSFVVTATDVAPPAILDNQSREILRLVVGNPAAGGPATVLLSSFGVRLEQATGAGLGTLQAGNLLATIEVYLDSNASGAFEPAIDTFVTALYSPDLAADGGLNIDLTASEPANVEVASGNTRNYFLVGHLTQDASAASPNAFRITHLASGSGASSAVNAANGEALILAAAPNVTSKVITATLNQAPTTTGIADVMAFDNAAQGIIPLYPAFQDAENASSQLTYTLTGNTNGSLFSFAAIEAATGKLLLTYAAGVTGTSQLTIKATDTLGKSVTTSFQVKVIPFVTYSDFQAVHQTTGGPLDHSLGNGLTNLLSYAFFLNQGANGGTMGLPRLQGVGNARVFSHLRPKQASDVFYNYQLSQNMLAWVPAVKNVDYYENTRDMGDGSVRVELLLLNGWQKAFMRVQTQLVGSAAPPPAPPDDGGGGPPPANLPAPPPPGTGVPILSSAAFPSQTILSTSLAAAAGMVVRDLTGDGFKDIVVASTNDDKVAWFQNNQNGTFGGAQVITTVVDGAFRS